MKYNLAKANDIYGHKFIAGMTQSGKTYLAKKMMQVWAGSVIFFNPEDEEIPGFLRADYTVDIAMLKKAIKRCEKINYVPSSEQKTAEKELEVLVKLIQSGEFEFNTPRVLFAVDEVQDFCRQGSVDNPLFYVVRRGLKRGIYGLFISQSPADVDKVILKQSLIHYIFRINSYDKGYYKMKNLPADEIEEKLKQGGQYSFVVWDNEKLSGPYKV